MRSKFRLKRRKRRFLRRADVSSPPSTSALTSITGVPGPAGGGFRACGPGPCGRHDHRHPVGDDQPQPPNTVEKLHPAGLQYRLGEVDFDLAEHGGHGEVLRHHPAAVRGGPAEDPGDHPAAVQPDRLRGRHGQIRRQLRELTERPGRRRSVNSFGKRLGGEPSSSSPRLSKASTRSWSASEARKSRAIVVHGRGLMADVSRCLEGAFEVLLFLVASVHRQRSAPFWPRGGCAGRHVRRRCTRRG